MTVIKERDIVEGCVSGIESYGVFVNIDENYSGLIHISEMDNGFVKDINSYVSIGEIIYVNVIGVNKETGHLNLSIKNINYKKEQNKGGINESIRGFLPLSKKLPEWMEEYEKK